MKIENFIQNEIFVVVSLISASIWNKKLFLIIIFTNIILILYFCPPGYHFNVDQPKVRVVPLSGLMRVNSTPINILKTVRQVIGDQELNIVTGERGGRSLIFNDYHYNMRNTHGNSAYWFCRNSYKDGGCSARLRTSSQPNGLYTLYLNGIIHNHLPWKTCCSEWFGQEELIHNL